MGGNLKLLTQNWSLFHIRLEGAVSSGLDAPEANDLHERGAKIRDQMRLGHIAVIYALISGRGHDDKILLMSSPPVTQLPLV